MLSLDVVQDLYSTDPTQEICVCRKIYELSQKLSSTDHAEHTAPVRQHELDHTDHTDHTDQEYGIYLR